MYSTMRGLLATLVLLLGALAMTGMLASGLQEKATAGHRVDEDFLPGGETIDRGGWRAEPKALGTDTGQPDAGHPAPAGDKARSRPESTGSGDDGL